MPGLPPQTGNSGKFLTTDGVSASWSDIVAAGSAINGDIDGSAANIAETLALSNGGTGYTAAEAALNALLPDQSGNAGYTLTTLAGEVSWKKIVNVVTTTKTDSWSYTVATENTWSAVTGLTAQVTVATGQKLVVIASITGGAALSSYALFRLTQDGSPILVGDTAGARISCTCRNFAYNSNTTNHVHPCAVLQLSSGTYTFGVEATLSTLANVCVNRTATDTNSASYVRGVSTLTVMVVE